ncbi:uncharacterized protein [Rutidosis leptorrhynchoides]|uniref:uncharacterized protein n=1 Tax=Rutidosis leptorrhynchoides TaxID=125765 RepID=UPI003A995D15
MYGDEYSSESFAKFASLSSLKLSDPCIPSIAEILEVVVDELLLHGRLRKYLSFIDSCSPKHERLFKLVTNRCDFGFVIEMLCSHFSLSFSDERALREFCSGITWIHSNKSKSLELSIIASRTLLHNPVVLSSPKLLQAHILSLVSNAISVTVNCETLTSDPKRGDLYLSVFEISVLLYRQHMSTLVTENRSEDARGTLVQLHNKSSQLSFESCIELSKKEKLDQTIAALNESWKLSLRNTVCKKKSDLLALSIEYMQENVCIIDPTCRDDIVTFLKCMLTRTANDVNDIELPLNGCASLQDICFLASLLMLMSNSLIQSVWSLKHQCPDSLNDKKYDLIVGIISCFKDFNIRLPIQKFAYGIMETNPSSHKESRLMLLHILGLLSLCFDSGFDFLVKSCISVIIGLTNLFVLEEGNVDALKSLADPKSSSEGYLIVYKEALICQTPTLAIISKYQKIRTSYVSNAYLANESTSTKNVETENGSTTLDPFNMGYVSTSKVETCSGETYLKTRFKESGCATDIDDLVDFVECKKGKDYADWLKSREKFRDQRLKKIEKLKWERRKQGCRKSMKRLDGLH